VKGFIGPIGDDIPSIFPIIAGVMLFIGAIVYVNAEAANNDAALHLRKSALELSYIVTEKGYVNAAQFAQACEDSVTPTAKKDGVGFAVLLFDCTKYGVTDIGEGEVICSNQPSFSAGAIGGKKASSLSYPIATDCQLGGETRPGLGTAVTIAWYA
jgi:hypothetical protein